MLISLVVPSYNEEEALPLFYKEAARVAAEMEKSHGAAFEFIFVDDGSKDKTLAVARRLHAEDARVPKATMWPPWTPTCRTRRPCCPKCWTRC